MTGGIPNLFATGQSSAHMEIFLVGRGGGLYLHRHQSVIDEDFFCKKVCSDRRLIASAELLVDLVAGEINVLAMLD